jgi:drug resistance efflux protein
VVQALSDGMTGAVRYSLLAATAFLALGFVSAMRVRRGANESSSMEQSN